ncbi:phosphotransferase [Clostridiaceae bacterium M8S5]|nr:phosphotransferase [Clostridiaceae bacterium M8S5]
MFTNSKYIKKRLHEIIENIDLIEPIGNHELKRHLVYKVVCGENKFVVKFYFKQNKWCREVFCLRHLANAPISVPKIIRYGIFDDGVEWVLLNFIEGFTLNSTITDISDDNLQAIYFNIGAHLSVIHSNKHNFFGSIDKNGNSLDNFKTFRDYHDKLYTSMIDHLNKFKHDNESIIKKSLKIYSSMFYILDDVKVASLCHNDFNLRNIMVSKTDGDYKLSAIIDFEQSFPCDVDRELIYFYLPLLENNPLLADSFKHGYEKYGQINIDKLYEKKDFYTLYKGLEICSWAKDNAYDYYLNGVKLLEDVIIKTRSKTKF